MTCCDPIPSTISETLKVGLFLSGLVAASFQYAAYSYKLSASLHSIFQHKNREYCHIVVWGDSWEEGGHIIFDSNIPCVILTNIL